MTIAAVLFDFGGVFTTSPFESFNAYEDEINVPRDTIRAINATNPDDNAWALFERSEVDIEGFARLFGEEAADRGFVIDGCRVIECLSGRLRPEMVSALDLIRATFRVGCITNNMASSSQTNSVMADVMSRFEVVVESSKLGIRKPDPRIYQVACDQLGIRPTDAVYLDDLGVNCKPARALGMTTIKVLTADQALEDLGPILDLNLTRNK